jgi:hypothetical protein
MVDVLYWLVNFSANTETGGFLERKTLTDPHRKTFGRKGLMLWVSFEKASSNICD